MADPYASFSSPVKAAADPYAAFSKPVTPSDVTAGGVQDFEPSQQPKEPATLGESINRTADRGASWARTRIIKGANALATTPRMVSDAIGMIPEGVRNQFPALEIPRAIGGLWPTAQEANDVFFRDLKVPERDSHSRVGKMVDAGAESLVPTVLMPGSLARNVLPAFMGGAASEAAGQATEGSKWEPLARVGAGVGVGLATAGVQNALGNVLQGVRNLFPNVDDASAKVIARNLLRDNMTADDLARAQGELGTGAMTVEAGGRNVKGMVRGAIAPPGEARTTMQDAFDARRTQLPELTQNALDKNLSPNASLGTTLDDLTALQKQQARPAYQAAGIPERPESRIFAIDEPKPVWNTPIVSTPALEKLYKDSTDIRGAIAAVRGLPDYKEVPYNSMTMWDKAYKRLGDMEQSARDAGKNSRANDIMNLRKDFLSALTAEDAAPKYQGALDAFSGPQKIKDAADRGKEWFSKNVDPAMVRREFQAMTPAEQQAAKEVGARDWAREIVSSRSGRGTADMASRTALLQGGDRARLQAIMSPEEFAALDKQMGTVKNALSTATDINVGSRTTPLALEAGDNALAQSSVMSDLLHGRLLSATGKVAGRAVERIGEGRTEAVNARIAELMASTDPEKVGLVKALAEKARLEELARRSGRMNALTYGGGLSPALNALNGTR